MLVSGAAADTYGIRPVAATGGAVIALSGALWFVLRRKSKHMRQGVGQDAEEFCQNRLR